MCALNIAGAILAAGFSRRLGRPKQDVVLGEFTLLNRAIRTAAQAQLHPLAVVVQDRRPDTPAEPPEICWISNANAAEGMGSSVRLAAAWARDIRANGLVLMTCDQPLLRPEHLQTLCAQPQCIVGSAYAGRVGVPAYFPASSFDLLLSMQGDQGARGLLQQARSTTEESLALDIDTEEDLRRAEQLLHVE